MTKAVQRPIKLFQFPRMFGIPNVSPFCCKLETWLRIAGVPYEVVDTPDPRKGPKGKLPFIEDAGVRIADTSLIVDHLVRTRGVDPDARLNPSQRAIALLVQRTLEEHYAFVLAYTHFVRDEGWQHTPDRFDSLPAIVRPLVRSMVRARPRQEDAVEAGRPALLARGNRGIGAARLERGADGHVRRAVLLRR
jgi:glutathione S-transferase